jgi:hypothetical protein
MKVSKADFVEKGVMLNGEGTRSVSEFHNKVHYDLEIIDGIWLRITALDGPRVGQVKLVPVFNLVSVEPKPVPLTETKAVKK